MKSIVNTQELRQHNMTLIIDALQDIEYGTKNAISKATGLSVATCGNLLSLLIESGQVLELELAPSTGGRPSRQFMFNKDFQSHGQMILEKYTDYYRISYHITNLLGEIIHTKSLDLKELNRETIMNCVKDMRTSYSNLSIIAIGIPGVYQNDEIVICDIDSLIGLSLPADIKRKYNIDVIIENDVNATALGFHKEHKANTFAYIYCPVGGPGAGIIINNTILRGTSHFAGEVGFIPVNEKKTLDVISKIIASITCIINPEFIVISGSEIKAIEIEDLKSQLGQWIPQAHIPKIIQEDQITDHYFKGLSLLTDRYRKDYL